LKAGSCSADTLLVASVTPKDGDDATTNDPSDEVTAVTPALSPPCQPTLPILASAHPQDSDWLGFDSEETPSSAAQETCQ